MTLAPDLVIACPHCIAPARVAQIESGNTFGAVTWSDGWQDAPMLPRPPRITRCEACGQAYWLAEATPIGQCGFTSEPEPTASANPNWQDAPEVARLDEAGLLQALAEGVAYSSELELELRVAIWWRGNDAFRKEGAEAGYPTSPEAIANMERIIEMTNGGQEDLLLFRAEAQRYLGRFDQVKATLEGVGCSDYWPAKSKLLEFAKAGDRRLRILFQ